MPLHTDLSRTHARPPPLPPTPPHHPSLPAPPRPSSLPLPSQFEATDARRAFPCWDEPAIKATFQLTVVVPSDRMAVSNTPVISTNTCAGRKTWKFAPTPKMSTYLLAVVVGDFDSTRSLAKHRAQSTRTGWLTA